MTPNKVHVFWIVTIAIGLASQSYAQGVKVEFFDDPVAKIGDQVVMRYTSKFVAFKPFLSELNTPSGVNILRNSPPDHKHHHGLMFAITANGVNFWEEQTAPGRQVHLGFAKYGDTGFEEALNWMAPATVDPMMTEIRRVHVLQDPEVAATLITWTTQLTPDPDIQVELTGTPYHGLGMRFVESMDTGGAFFNADDKTGVDGTNNKQSNWCAYTATADGNPVTVAVFNDPKNPRPATWFTMTETFAYISATLALDKEPLKLSRDGIRLIYGVALWDGEQTKDTVEKAYRRWLAIK